MGRTITHDDTISVESITDRVDELREERSRYSDDFGEAEVADAPDTGDTWAGDYPDDAEELETLGSLLAEIEGSGGDHQWAGSWYPGELIADSHFEDYARALAEDIGTVKPDMPWPLGCIDWERAARELQMDYTSVEFNGRTYWYR